MRIYVWLLAAAFAVFPGFAQTTGRTSGERALLEDLPVVEAASLHAQTLAEAPANVTIISADDIRRYGYRTLGEALASVRGFYVTNDRSYQYVGLRGFSLPGDYNTRFLVMINGHVMTENVYGSNSYFGQDFGLDMDLVRRIEIIRGPSSALYGSNGMFATINIVTRSPVEGELARASVETDTFGESKALMTTSLNLGHGANLFMAGSVFNGAGQSLYFPELDTPETNNGVARGVDGERGYHAFTNLVWRNWSFTALLSSREKNFPTPSFGTIFGDRGNKILDERDFAEAAWSRDVGVNGNLRWRLYYDQCEYWGRYDMPGSAGIRDNRDLSHGNWAGSQLVYRFELPRHFGALTAGAELNADIRTVQQNFDVNPYAEHLNLNTPDLQWGAFLQHEWQFRRAWTLDLGLRVDDARNHPHFVSPRIALLYQHSPRTVYKVMAGIAFRNPSAYELFYDDQGASQIANPLLKPEQIHTLEAAVERKISQRLSAVATVYHYKLRDLIQAFPVADQLVQYQNISHYTANGIEFEVNGRLWREVEGGASVAFEDMDKLDGPHEQTPNSPRTLGKVRLSMPVRHVVTLAGAFQYMSARGTFVADEHVPAVYLTDVTLTTNRLHPSFDIQLGVRNLLDQKAWDPASPGQGIDLLARDSRSAFLKLIWHTRR